MPEVCPIFISLYMNFSYSYFWWDLSKCEENEWIFIDTWSQYILNQS